jgi:hypothetical protein
LAGVPQNPSEYHPSDARQLAAALDVVSDRDIRDSFTDWAQVSHVPCFGTDVPPWMAVKRGLPRAPAGSALFLCRSVEMFSETLMLYGDRTLSILLAALTLSLLIKAAWAYW